MDAITEGWAYSRRAKRIQFVSFEQMLDRPLADVRAEFGCNGPVRGKLETVEEKMPELLAA